MPIQRFVGYITEFMGTKLGHHHLRHPFYETPRPTTTNATTFRSARCWIYAALVSTYFAGDVAGGFNANKGSFKEFAALSELRSTHPSPSIIQWCCPLYEPSILDFLRQLYKCNLL